ncbi:MAG: ATP-binding cassette domain-containing protein [Thalassobaculum sp.]|uniref:branched-chain amino acid ABC transporter ATP-binding protein/permease n=1 Tax=Thalassobaculum sp. TaxID=2022740 RepID=UPI0032ED09C5
MAPDRRTLVYLAALVLGLGAVVGLGDAYVLRVATLVGIYAIAAIGYQLVFGRLGLLSLAQGALFGIGAYASAIMCLELGLPAPIGLLAAMLVPAAVGALVALPIARLESHYVALATLGLAQLALLAATNLEITGGANGLYGVPPIAGGPVQIGPLSVGNGLPMLALVWALVLAALLVSRWVLSGGRLARLATIRDAPHAALTLGLNPVPARLALFAVAGGFGGLAGGLQAHGLGVVSPAVTGFEVMVTILTIAVVGGRGSALGAVAGAALLVPLPEFMRFLEGGYLVAYGVVLLAAIVLVPRGLDGRLRDRLPRRPPRLPEIARPSVRRRGKALIVDGLRKRFGGVTALDGVSFSVPAGTVVGLIGANGSGKTTALNLISGLETPDGGQIRLGGVPLGDRAAHHRSVLGLGRGFQHPEVPEGLFVLEAVAVGAADRTVAMAALDGVGLAGRAADPVAALGAAELRRLDLARALATGPEALILDEPAAGLTGDERAALAALLRRLATEGLAVLVVDHGMDFLMPLADRIVCLDAGKVLAAGTPEEVRRNPAVVAAYLGQGVAA